MALRRGKRPVLAGRKSLMIDWRRQEVGRIQKSSGTTDQRVYNSIISMLDSLYSYGKLDLLREIKAGSLKPLDALQMFNRGELDRRTTTIGSRLLRDVIPKWLETANISPKTAVNYTRVTNAFLAARPNATLDSLQHDLIQWKKRLVLKAEAPSMFRQCRVALMSLTAQPEYGGQYGPLWLSVKAVTDIKYDAKISEPLTPHEALKLLGEITNRDVAHTLLVLLFTGMRKSEYYDGLWKIYDNGRGIEVRGTKTKRTSNSSLRITLANLDIRPFYGRVQQFEKNLTVDSEKAIGRRVWPHLLRHTFAHWLDMAGIPTSRIDSYMGHSPNTVPGHYRSHSVTAHLTDDQERLRVYLEDQLSIKSNLYLGDTVVKKLTSQHLTNPGDYPVLALSRRISNY